MILAFCQRVIIVAASNLSEGTLTDVTQTISQFAHNIPHTHPVRRKSQVWGLAIRQSYEHVALHSLFCRSFRTCDSAVCLFRLFDYNDQAGHYFIGTNREQYQRRQ